MLKPDGFALITCPDLETVADLILSKGLDNEAYQSPAGSISSLDMLYDHSRSIAGGRTYMAHRTGFTCPRLGQLLIDAQFSTALAKRDRFDLWALALMPIANQERIQQDLKHRGLDMFDDGA